MRAGKTVLAAVILAAAVVFCIIVTGMARCDEGHGRAWAHGHLRGIAGHPTRTEASVVRGGWTAALVVTGDGAPRAYGVMPIDPAHWNADSAYFAGPVRDRLFYSPLYESDWQPSCAGFAAFAYHEPGYYGGQFWAATGKDTLWGTLLCDDLGLAPDTTCTDRWYFPTNQLWWGMNWFTPGEADYDVVMARGDKRTPPGWWGAFHTVEMTPDSLILRSADLRGPSQVRIEVGRIARAR